MNSSDLELLDIVEGIIKAWEFDDIQFFVSGSDPLHKIINDATKIAKSKTYQSTNLLRIVKTLVSMWPYDRYQDDEDGQDELTMDNAITKARNVLHKLEGK